MCCGCCWSVSPPWDHSPVPGGAVSQWWGWWACAASNPSAWISSGYNFGEFLKGGSVLGVKFHQSGFSLNANGAKRPWWCVQYKGVKSKKKKKVAWTILKMETFSVGLVPAPQQNYCTTNELCHLMLIEAPFPPADNCTVPPASTKACHAWYVLQRLMLNLCIFPLPLVFVVFPVSPGLNWFSSVSILEHNAKERKPLCAALWHERIQQPCAGSRCVMFGADFNVNVLFATFIFFFLSWSDANF